MFSWQTKFFFFFFASFGTPVSSLYHILLLIQLVAGSSGCPAIFGIEVLTWLQLERKDLWTLIQMMMTTTTMTMDLALCCLADDYVHTWKQRRVFRNHTGCETWTVRNAAVTGLMLWFVVTLTRDSEHIIIIYIHYHRYDLFRGWF